MPTDLKSILSEDESSLAKALAFSKGLALTIPHAAAALGHTAANVVQAISPVAVPYATNPMPTSFEQRAAQLGDAATLGLGKAAYDRYQAGAEEAPPANLEDKINLATGAAAKTLLMDVLPGSEVAALESGQLSSEQSGEAVGAALLKSLPLMGVLGKLQAGLAGAKLGGVSSLGKVEGRFLSKVITEGELTRAYDRAVNPLSMDEGIALRSPNRTRLADSMKSIANISDDELARIIPNAESIQGRLDLEDIKNVRDAAWASDVKTSTMEQLLKSGSSLYDAEATAKVIMDFDRGARAGSIDLATSADPLGRLSRQWATKYNIPVEDAPRTIAATFMKTASMSAQELNAVALPTERLLATTLLQISKGGEQGAAALKQLRLMKRMEENAANANVWTKLASAYNNKVEGFRRAAMTSQLATTLRNAESQAGISVLQLVEDAAANTLEAAVGTVKGLDKPISSYYHETLADFATMASRFIPSQRRELSRLLDSVPLVKHQLESASAMDLQNSVLFTTLRGKNPSLAKTWEMVKPEGVGDAFDLAKSILTSHNHFQEIEFRRYFFQARLDANLRRLGITNWQDIIPQAKVGPLAEPIREAMADAMEHSLKQTLAYTPEGGVAGAILKLYNKVPGSYAVLPPFPRFLMNQYRWQMEHSPTTWFNIFDKGFREQLLKAGEGGAATADAYRALGKATSGLMLMNAAWVLRNMPEVSGPKYYQLKDPLAKAEDPANEAFVDMRSMQPFSSFLALADWVKSVKDGKPMTISANEKLDALVGIRRLGEVALFALPDVLRAADSDDPKAFEKAMHTVEGQYFASFFTPLHTLRELAGAAAPQSQFGFLRDTQGQELSGPTRAILPGLMDDLPVRYDPFSGQPQAPEHPLLRQLLGVTVKDLSKFERLIYETHGTKLSDLIGEYGDATANNLVAKHVGLQLQTPLPTGVTLGDQLASAINNANLEPPLKQLVMKEVMTALKQSAHRSAMAENILPFLEGEIERQVPPSMKQNMRNTIKRLLQPQ